MTKKKIKPVKNEKKVKKVKVEKPKKYLYELREEVIYVGGLYEKYNGKECVVIGRSKDGWFRIKFSEDEKEILTPVSTLKRKEDVVDSN